MLEYKDIIIKHYALGMSGQALADTLPDGSTSGVNRFLAAFKACKELGHPLPEGITNYGIAAAVYGVDTTVNEEILAMNCQIMRRYRGICPPKKHDPQSSLASICEEMSGQRSEVLLISAVLQEVYQVVRD